MGASSESASAESGGQAAGDVSGFQQSCPELAVQARRAPFPGMSTVLPPPSLLHESPLGAIFNRPWLWEKRDALLEACN